MELKALRKGDKGSRVRAWQYFLIGQGLTRMAADGDFGKKTEEATVLFQKKHKLQADGVVGNRTYLKAMELGFQLVSDAEDDTRKGPNWPSPPAFRPLSPSALQSRFGKIEFQIKPDGSSVKILNDWQKKNLVTLKIPQLKHLPPYRTDKISVHAAAADAFGRLFKDWEKAGLLKHLRTYDGAFNPRLVRGSKTNLSTHAYGAAIDFNVAWNKLGSEPARAGTEGSVRELVAIANNCGFYWGGHFSRKDGMHFELAR